MTSQNVEPRSRIPSETKRLGNRKLNVAVADPPMPSSRNVSPSRDLVTERGIMANSNTNSHVVPALIATAVAAVGLLSLILVDHGPWSAPKVESETMIQYGTTAAAAQAAGAAVTETAPKPVLEPVAPGPKPAQPAIPDPSKS